MRTAPKTPAALADQAAEAVHSLNHATLSAREGWEHPVDAYDVVGDLARLAMMLPQALLQTGRMFNDLADNGRVGVDAGGPHLTEMKSTVEEALLSAVASAQQLREHLDQAHAALSHATYKHA